MRVMVLVKGNDEIEAGVLPTTEEFAAMGTFNEELVNAGVMLAGDGLKPSSKGKRVRFGGEGATTVLDGPFAETKELVSGYWIWQVASMDEALEWLRRAPFGDGAEIEVRPFYEPEDFGEAFTPEMQEREQTLRDRL